MDIGFLQQLLLLSEEHRDGPERGKHIRRADHQFRGIHPPSSFPDLLPIHELLGKRKRELLYPNYQVLL